MNGCGAWFDGAADPAHLSPAGEIALLRAYRVPPSMAITGAFLALLAADVVAGGGQAEAIAIGLLASSR